MDKQDSSAVESWPVQLEASSALPFHEAEDASRDHWRDHSCSWPGSTHHLTTMSTSPGSSKRWKHFHSALQLATQRAANKWRYTICLCFMCICAQIMCSYEDFKACFPQYCSEEPDGSRQAMSMLQSNMQMSIEVRAPIRTS